MCRRIVYAPAALVVVAMMSAARAAEPTPVAPDREKAIRALDLGQADEVPADWFSPAPLAFSPLPPEPEDRPAVVPLPPAVGPGMAGLATLAAIRFGRRTCRRR
jgi:hypothetical protein